MCGARDLPANLQPGSTVAFDQFTLTRHNLHETPGHDSARHVVFEVVTSRGMYLGRSDSVEDTTHLLPGACNSRSPLPTTPPTKPVPAVSVNVSSCN